MYQNLQKGNTKTTRLHLCWCVCVCGRESARKSRARESVYSFEAPHLHDAPEYDAFTSVFVCGCGCERERAKARAREGVGVCEYSCIRCDVLESAECNTIATHVRVCVCMCYVCVCV